MNSNTDIFLYESPILGNYNVYNSTLPDQYMLAVLEGGCFKSVSGVLPSGIINIYRLLNYHIKKEKLFLTAIDNLIKKNDYLQLTIQLDQDLISEQDFQDELERNENKYLIRMNIGYNQEDFNIASEILPNLNRDFSADDVSELFSISIEKVHAYLDKIEKENVNSL